MYYVYIHKNKQTGEVVYCGKGSKQRYSTYTSRCEEHILMMRKNMLEYVIVRNFNDESEAYKYEEKLTAHYKKLGHCKFNISIGRRTSQETKIKLSNVLKGKKRSKETKEKIKKNHNRPLAKTVLMYKEDKLIKIFQSSREAGAYAAGNGISSYSWCWRSLKTGEITKPTKDFPIGGYRFVYQDDKIS